MQFATHCEKENTDLWVFLKTKYQKGIKLKTNNTIWSLSTKLPMAYAFLSKKKIGIALIGSQSTCLRLYYIHLLQGMAKLTFPTIVIAVVKLTKNPDINL